MQVWCSILSLVALVSAQIAVSPSIPPAVSTPAPPPPGTPKPSPPATAPPPSTSEPPFSTQYKLYGWHGCSSLYQGAILAALEEKTKITKVSDVYSINWHHKGVVEFFGDPSNLLFNKAPDGETFRAKIQQNLRNLYEFGNGWWFNGNEIEIFCGDGSFNQLDKKDWCATKPGHIHFVRNYDKHDAMMVCDSWFRMPTLDGAIKLAQDSIDVYNLARYENRAIPLMAALVQKAQVGTWPLVGITRRSAVFSEYGRKWLTTPTAIRYFGQRRVTGTAYTMELARNADTYGWFAMAMYVQQEVLKEYPDLPQIPIDIKFEWENRVG